MPTVSLDQAASEHSHCHERGICCVRPWMSIKAWVTGQAAPEPVTTVGLFIVTKDHTNPVLTLSPLGSYPLWSSAQARSWRVLGGASEAAPPGERSTGIRGRVSSGRVAEQSSVEVRGSDSSAERFIAGVFYTRSWVLSSQLLPISRLWSVIWLSMSSSWEPRVPYLYPTYTHKPFWP